MLDEILAATKGSVGVTAAMKEVNRALRKRYEEMFPKFQMQPIQGVPLPVRPTLSIVLCGYDRGESGKNDMAKLYSMTSPLDFAPQLHEYGFCVQGIPQFAVYLLNRLHRPDTLLKEAMALAAYTISETAAQDGKVGGPVQMITITPGRASVELNREEVDAIIRGNEDRATRLRELFFQRG